MTEAKKPKLKQLTNEDRKQWIDDDAELYRQFTLSGLSYAKYIKEFKSQIDARIHELLLG